MGVAVVVSLLAVMGSLFAAETIDLALAESVPIEFARTHHVQGVARDENRWYITSVDRGTRSGWLFALSAANHRLDASHRLALAAQIHPGGMQLREGKLYVPLAEYRPTSTSSILVIEAATCRVERTIPIDDHIGACASAEDGTLVLGNWDCRDIYTVDREGHVVAKRPNPTGVAYQDWEVHDGKIWGSGNTTLGGERASVVDVIDLATLTLEKRFRLLGERKTGGDDFSREGFTKVGNSLWLLPEDGPNTTLYRFDLP